MQNLESMENLRERYDNLFEVLTEAKKMCDVALPGFNWGASCLTGEQIELLNEVPQKINKALAIEEELNEAMNEKENMCDNKKV